MIRSASCPWAWTQSSRSTPTSSMYNLPFTSHFRRSCSVEILSRKIPEEYDSWKLSSAHIKEGIGSSQRGFLEHIPQTSGVIITSSKVEHGWQSRGYNLPKALYTRGKAHKVIEYEGRCRMKSNNGSGDPQRSWCEYLYSIRGRKIAWASDYRTSE